MKKVLFTHIYNEEYLLPFWIKQHRDLFDHLVVVDRFSTDNSRDIIGDMWPGAEIHTSAYPQFDGLKTDYEMIQHEVRFEGCWKLILNATEFVASDQLDRCIIKTEESGRLGLLFQGAVMIDTEPDIQPSCEKKLTEQKYSGVYEADFDYKAFGEPVYMRLSNRSRLLHRAYYGCYGPGRHQTALPATKDIPRYELSLWWYAFSPMNPQNIARKVQIGQAIPTEDVQRGWGAAHLAKADEIHARHASLLPFARDLRSFLQSPKPTLGPAADMKDAKGIIPYLRQKWTS